jgi:hemoglobin
MDLRDRAAASHATRGYDTTMSIPSDVPSLCEWSGGSDAIERLFVRFYERVPAEPLLRDVFARMDPAHAQHVAAFVAEVFGGPTAYSRDHGGHPHMIRKHLGRALTEPQRRQWMALLLDCADEVGLPTDPEFRSAFVAYIEWGSRLAVVNSQPGATADAGAPMPRWGWGEPKGPYRPDR